MPSAAMRVRLTFPCYETDHYNEATAIVPPPKSKRRSRRSPRKSNNINAANSRATQTQLDDPDEQHDATVAAESISEKNGRCDVVGTVQQQRISAEYPVLEDFSQMLITEDPEAHANKVIPVVQSSIPAAAVVTPASGSIWGACICERCIKHLHCRYCGHLFSGRVSSPCPRHPKSIFLMDHTACPNCRSPATECLSEVDQSTGHITAPSGGVEQTHTTPISKPLPRPALPLGGSEGKRDKWRKLRRRGVKAVVANAHS